MNKSKPWLPGVLSFSGIIMMFGDRRDPWTYAVGMLGALMLAVGLLTLMKMIHNLEKEIQQMKDKLGTV